MTILFFYLGWSFISGVVIFAITFYINMALGRRSANLQKDTMTCSDSRIKTTNESMNNIKMLKLYSWTEIFAKTISDKRQAELAVLWKRFKNGWAVVVSLYFFPQILSAVVFGFYIGTGHTLQLDVAFTVMTILTMIKDPLRSLPMFVGTGIEFMVSMRRI
jgi:ABC-type multidrug transport system fused ATPase/permease subunit